VNTRRVTLLVAVILALGTGVLTLRYLSSLQQPTPVQQQQEQKKEVVVAAQDIPAHTKVTADMLRMTTKSAADVEPDAVSDPRQIDGLVSVIGIPSGGTITLSKVTKPAWISLPVRLPPGMRAVSIAMDKVRGAGGFIQPGDRVDILAVRGGDERAGAILRGILILAVNSSLDAAGATPAPDQTNVSTITVALTPTQADLLIAADTNASLRLALRNPTEPANSLPTEAYQFGPKPPKPAPPAPLPIIPHLEPPQVGPPQPPTVQIIDGSK